LKTPLTVRSRTREDDPILLDIYLQTEDVFRFTLEAWRFHMDERARVEGKKPVVMVGEVGGEIVGDWYVDPHYSGTDGVFFAAVEIAEVHQGRGYGSDLWRDAERYLRERGVTKAYNSIRENLERSQRFAADRGFERTGRADRMSRLVLADANLEGYEAIDAEMEHRGITIRTIAEIGTDDDAFLRDLYEATSAMIADIPRSEENWDPDPYDVWRKNFLQWPGAIAEAYWVALQEGHPVGMANLQKNGESGLLNGLTGVIPAARHQGIARALKFRTIQWARVQGFEHIDTANDSANAPMLSINIPLGYKALPAREEWVKLF